MPKATSRRWNWCLWAVAVAVTSPAILGAPPSGSPDPFDLGAAPEEETFFDSRDRVKVTATAAQATVARGGDLPVAIIFEIDHGWHIWTDARPLSAEYTEFSGAIHTTVVESASSVGIDPNPAFVVWPAVHSASADLGDGPGQYAVFDGRAIAYLPVTIADDAPLGPATIQLTIGFQACDDRSCLAPADQAVTVAFDIVETGGSVAQPGDDFARFPPDLFGKIRSGAAAPDVVGFNLFGIVSFQLDTASTVGMLLLLLVSALGGFLLNLTPCVLPIIPIKVMGLSQAASGSRSRTLALGVAMCAGIIGFWLILGGLIAGVSKFTATNQLFQYPLFTIGVGLFIALMAVGMCGLFSIQLPQSVYLINPNHETIHGSVIFGVMAAILSTPCTAPFMGAAAAWAATKTPPIILLTFAAIGVGMAIPYLILSAFPALVQKMPRTGPASELIKQVMGLLMLAAAAYFVGVGVSGLLVSPPSPPSQAYWWFVALFGIAAGGWLAYRTFRITPAVGRRVIFGGVGVLILLISGAIGVQLNRKGPIDWVYFTPDRFESAKGNGDVVVMKFTAAWCLNCHTLEQTVFHNPKVVALMAENNITPMKVDLTGKNVDGNMMLKKTKSVTIPWLVVFRPDGTEVFRRNFYTVQQVVDAVEEARGTTVARR